MPGLGLGAGLNRQQQNRFNTAAQQGQGQQFLASRPGIANRVANNPAAQNFANTGQVGANAAPRFQPGGARAPGAPAAPQGSGATGAPKPSAGGGGGQQPQQPLGGMSGGNPQPTPPQNYLSGPGSPGQQPMQGYQTPSQWQAAIDAQNRANGIDPRMMGGPMGPVNMAPYMTGGNMGQPGGGMPGVSGGGGALPAYQGPGVGQSANAAGGQSAQSGLQNQQQQNLIQQIMQAFGGGAGQQPMGGIGAGGVSYPNYNPNRYPAGGVY